MLTSESLAVWDQDTPMTFSSSAHLLQNILAAIASCALLGSGPCLPHQLTPAPLCLCSNAPTFFATSTNLFQETIAAITFGFTGVGVAPCAIPITPLGVGIFPQVLHSHNAIGSVSSLVDMLKYVAGMPHVHGHLHHSLCVLDRNFPLQCCQLFQHA